MVIAHNIEVYLARKRDHGHRYPEYAIPVGSPQDNFDPKEVFIEVPTDDSFAIFVNLLEGYDPKRATHVQMRFWIDAPQGTATDTETHTFTVLEAAANEMGRTSLKGRFVKRDTWRKRDGNWLRCEFAFGALIADESLDMCEEEVAGELEQYSKIVVEVQRGRETTGKKVKLGEGDWVFTNDADDLRNAAKDLVKDGHLSHAVKHIIWTPSKGNRGKTVRFTIRYRSRDALERLGIVLKDDSAEFRVPATEEEVRASTDVPVISVHGNASADDEVQIIESRIVDDDIEVTQTRPCENPGSGQWTFAASAVKIERGIKRTHAQIDTDREALELEEQEEEAKATLRKIQLKQRKAKLEREMENGSDFTLAMKDEDEGVKNE
ncbi:hypothetical protein LTR95_016232 [Oleoguttula sp. CCFEE 5521]